MANQIKFYRVSQPYGFFSNFSKHPIKLEGKVWPTSEHYYQAKKFEGTEFEEAVRLCDSPMEAAKLGRDKSKPLVKGWDRNKDSVMYKAIKAKFTQHRDLLKKLVETGDAELVEHTDKDSYWADGGDGSGKNMLGVLLMKLRSEFKASPENILR